MSVQRMITLAAPCTFVLGLLVAPQVGCRPQESIQQYELIEATEAVPAQAPSDSSSQASAAATQAPAAAAERGEPTHQMLAAIIPTGDRAWFVKWVGPVDQVEQHRAGWDAIVASLRIEQGKPEWELPEGWTEGPQKPMRLATLLPPEAKPGSELSIIGLPMVGEWDEQVLSNVNRWLGQLKQPTITAAQLAEKTTKLSDIEGANEGSVQLDAVGWFDDGGMSRAPFAGRMAPDASEGPQAKQAAAPPAAPVAAPAASGQTKMTGSVPVGRGELKHTPPEGWTDLPGSAMRKASLQTEGGAVITAFVFPATAPAMADPLANVDRWRREVGLGPTTQEELDASSEKITLAGAEATYVELIGAEKSTLAAMQTRGNQVWFFKLIAPTAEAEAQRDAMKAWLGSVEL